MIGDEGRPGGARKRGRRGGQISRRPSQMWRRHSTLLCLSSPSGSPWKSPHRQPPRPPLSKHSVGLPVVNGRNRHHPSTVESSARFPGALGWRKAERQ